ncbi:MAG TPA: hypothetical protein VNW92_01655, partial [Polyangiaceae bacterium]|nr:hypothetical protein [Polyangiaceae bacterium]
MSRIILALLPLVTLACSANSATTSTTHGGGGATGSGGTVSIIGTGGSDGGSTSVIGSCTSACMDFPTPTQLDGAATPDAASKFADANAGGPAADCISEPQDGALVPRNWWRPRIHFAPQPGETLFEIRVHADIEQNDLLVYTTNNSYLIPEAAWQGVAAHAAGSALTITVRGTSASGGTLSKATTKLNIAPVDAGGAMVYWATTSVAETTTASKLIGFKVGEEGTVDALHITDVKEANLFNEAGMQKPTPPVAGGAPAGDVSCIGCHTSTPDGSAVAFKDGWPWAGIVASVEKDTVGQRPSYVTDVGARDMQQPFIGTFTFSPAFWSPTSHLGVSVYSEATPGIPAGGSWTGANRNIVTSSDLVWLELSAPGTMPMDGASVNTAVLADKGMTWGVIARSGDTRAAVMPDWSHDGKTVAYTST